MYDVKGNEIELTYDFELLDEGLKSYDMLIKRYGLNFFADNHDAGSESKNIKIQASILDYLIDEGRLQEFVDVLPNTESITVELKDITKPMLDTTNLIKLRQILANKGISLYITDEKFGYNQNILYHLDDVLFAGKQLDDWASEINSATVDGKSLSPLEKFIYAYMIVQDRMCKKCEIAPRLSRDAIAVLNNNYCVCKGYAALLNELCARIGIPCTDKYVITSEHHAINCSIIKDDKYGIEGLYYSDVTKDSKIVGNTLFSCLLPSVEDIFERYENSDACRVLDNAEENLIQDKETLKQTQQNTKKIDYKAMTRALATVFVSKGKTRNDAGRYLSSSFDKVRDNPDFYRNCWVYDCLKAMGKIEDYKY